MQKDNILSAMIDCYRYTHCNVNARTAVSTSLFGINGSFRNYGREKLSEYDIDLLDFDKECKQFRTNRIKYVPSKYPTFTKLANKLIGSYIGAERTFIGLVTVAIKDIVKHGGNGSKQGTMDLERNYLVRNRIALLIACLSEFCDFFMHYVKQQFESTYAVFIGDTELNKGSTLLCTSIWLTQEELLKELKDNIAHFDKFVTARVAQKGLIKE